MFLYMFAFQLTSVIEQAFFIYKACTVNHNYSHEICSDLTNKNYTDIKKEVQVQHTDSRSFRERIFWFAFFFVFVFIVWADYSVNISSME